MESPDSRMTGVYDSIAGEIRTLASKNVGKMTIVGFAGPPGAGKSTTVSQLCRRLGEKCIVAPMDGFHYYRKELDAFEDKETAHARRGAPFTFNAEAFVNRLRVLRDSGHAKLPSFDHAVGDPVEDDIVISYPEHEIVLVEGNYLLLDYEPWSKVKELVDYMYFIDCPLETIRTRIIGRHQSVGLSYEAAQGRADNNDILNGMQILKSKGRADSIIMSL